jgi:hypothetical protein
MGFCAKTKKGDRQQQQAALSHYNFLQMLFSKTHP